MTHKKSHSGSNRKKGCAGSCTSKSMGIASIWDCLIQISGPGFLQLFMLCFSRPILSGFPSLWFNQRGPSSHFLFLPLNSGKDKVTFLEVPKNVILVLIGCDQIMSPCLNQSLWPGDGKLPVGLSQSGYTAWSQAGPIQMKLQLGKDASLKEMWTAVSRGEGINDEPQTYRLPKIPCFIFKSQY